MVLIQSWSRAVRCSLEKDEPIELTLGDVLLNIQIRVERSRGRFVPRDFGLSDGHYLN
jgi:hypothetical protein